MDAKREKHISKLMSLILRHKAEEFDIPVDSEGWCSLSKVLGAMAKSKVSRDEVKEVVANNSKQRFSFKDNFHYIRANQGHSLAGVNIKFETRTPPEYLYHGTALSKKDLIWEGGIKAMNRNLVHLSDSVVVAIQVGSRHGKPFLFKVNAKLMGLDGLTFYISENDVWLTDYIDPKYLEEYHVHKTT